MTDSSVSSKEYKPDRLTILPRRALDPPAPLQRPLGRRVPPRQWLQSADGQGSVPGGIVYIMLTRCTNRSTDLKKIFSLAQESQSTMRQAS